MTSRPYATTSGFTRPTPAGSSHVVIPRLLKPAIASFSSMPPTPMTSIWSAGLFSVPNSGPSLPIADTMMIPFAVTSHTCTAARPPGCC